MEQASEIFPSIASDIINWPAKKLSRPVTSHKSAGAARAALRPLARDPTSAAHLVAREVQLETGRKMEPMNRSVDIQVDSSGRRVPDLNSNPVAQSKSRLGPADNMAHGQHDKWNIIVLLCCDRRSALSCNSSAQAALTLAPAGALLWSLLPNHFAKPHAPRPTPTRSSRPEPETNVPLEWITYQQAAPLGSRSPPADPQRPQFSIKANHQNQTNSQVAL